MNRPAGDGEDDRDDVGPNDVGGSDALDSFLEGETDDPDVGPTIPQVPDTAARAGEVDPRLRRRFWGLVVVFNVALFATSLGLMFLVFEGNLDLGGRLFVAGSLLLLVGYYYYRKTKRELIDADGDAD